MKLFALLAFVLLASLASASAQTAKLSADDLKVLEGPKWVGNLTYLDYGSNKKVSIKSNVTITRNPAHFAAWDFAYEYPDEPKANSKSQVTLEAGGTIFDGKTVIERKKTADGTLTIVAIKDGTDNNKKALFRYTYTVGKSSFTVKKDVQLEGSTEYFERNTYSWTR